MSGKISFILKDQKKITDENGKPIVKETKALIFLVFRYKELRLKISTGEKVLPKFWNPKEHRVRIVRDLPECRTINQALMNHEINVRQVVIDHIAKNDKRIIPSILKNEIIKVVRPQIEQPNESDTIDILANIIRSHMIRNKKVIPEKLTNEISKVINPENKEQGQIDFFKAIDEFINTSVKAKGTIVSYEVNKRSLMKFAKTLDEPITFNTIDLVFYNSYVKWMKEIEGFAPNTIGNRIKTLKVFMSYFIASGKTENQSYLGKNFIRPRENTESIYLNESELLALYNHDFTNNPKYERVRDTFIIGCCTGLRFSDLLQLTSENITKDELLRVKTIKTHEEVIIPLHWMVKEILKKYDYQLPRVISNQKMNQYLKLICKEVENDDIKKKSDLVCTHTARRSFATNSYLSGLDPLTIMAFTGHKTESIFMKYIKVTKEETAKQSKSHKYFNKPKSKKGK